MKKIKKDTVVIPGVYKSGTSSIHKTLVKHDRIKSLENEKRKIKEPYFFSLKPKIVDEHFQWYKSLFSAKQCLHIDASVSYFLSPHSVSLIDKYIENVKYIIAIRDPLERVHSSYLHMNARLNAPEKRSLRRVVKNIHKNKNRGIIEAENELIKEAAAQGLIDEEEHDEEFLRRRCSAPFAAPFQDPLWDFKYVQHSMYSKWIPRFRKSDGSVLVVALENLISNPQKVMSNIFEYLGVREPQEIELKHSNKTNAPTTIGKIHQKIYGLLRKSPTFRSIIDTRLMNTVKDKVRPLLYSTRDKSTAIDEHTRALLFDLLSDEYEYWRKRRPQVVEYWGNISA